MSNQREKPRTLWIWAIITPCVIIALLGAVLLAVQRFRSERPLTSVIIFPDPSIVDEIYVTLPAISDDPIEHSYTLPQQYIEPLVAAFRPVIPPNLHFLKKANMRRALADSV